MKKVVLLASAAILMGCFTSCAGGNKKAEEAPVVDSTAVAATP